MISMNVLWWPGYWIKISVYVKLKQIKFLTCPDASASFTPSSTVRSLICYGVERVTDKIIKY